MPTEPVLVPFPESAYRVERTGRSLGFSRISPIDAASPAGNRFDVPGAGVLYGASELRGRDRVLTRALAGWLYAQTDPHGRPRYGGIRYVSRLGPFECWALFDGTAVRLVEERAIAAAEPALTEIAALFELEVD